MTCTNFPKDNLVPNVTQHQVGNVTYLYKGGAPTAPLWEAITPPINLDQVHTRTFANVDAMLAFNGLVVGQVVKTTAYYGGWAALGAAPVGGSFYTVVTKQEHDLIRSKSTVDERGDHTLPSGDIALLIKGDVVCITQYGAWQHATPSTNSMAIQSCWDNNQASKMPDGTFEFNTSLVHGTGYGWSFHGTDFTSTLLWTGDDAEWAIYNPAPSYNIKMTDFTISGPAGTVTKQLLNMTEVRYSEMINVVAINALVCMKHNANWLNKFTSCVYACSDDGLYDGVTESTAVWLASDNLPTDVSNATNFDNCRIEAARYGVLCNGGGRSITFSNSTVFEQNYYHIKISGIQNIRTLLVDGCYMEAAYGAPLFVDAGNIPQGSIDGVQICNTMVTCGPSDYAALLYIKGVAAQDINIALINNTIEFATNGNIPATGMIIYTPDNTINITLTYETAFKPRTGDGVTFTPIHYDKDKINLRRFTTNVPFRLTYSNGSDGNPFSYEGTQDLLMECRNGTARIFGQAYNPANTTVNPTVCSIPVNADPTTAVFGSYTNQTTGAQLCVVAGQALQCYALAGDRAYIDMSYRMSRGVQVRCK